MTEARVVLTRGDLVEHNILVSDRADDLRTFRRVLLVNALADGSVEITHGKDARDPVVVQWVEPDGRRLRIEPGRVVRFRQKGATLEVTHYAETIKFRR
jgi:hypothetical protein